MFKKIGLVSVVAFALFAFNACGDDSNSTSAPGENESSSSVISGIDPESSSFSSIIANSSSSLDDVDRSSSSDVDAEYSSSSSENSSSSSVSFWSFDVPKEDRLNPEITYGTMTDKRDGKTYKTVKIGDQVWMAENLNYDPGNVFNTSYAWSGCYNNVDKNCGVTGRLYTWVVARNNADCDYGKECDATLKPATPIQGICPSDWHLPTKAEFNTLVETVGGASIAGDILKSGSGWYKRNGTDAYGFSALPAGFRGDIFFYHDGVHARFWSASEYDSYEAYYLGLVWDLEKGDMYHNYKYYAFSVRCVMNSKIKA